MKKRLCSRLLTVAVLSSGFFGASAIAQDKPSAADLLDRGQRLYTQQQFTEAKKILLEIDPAQLPEDQRGKLTKLLADTDTALSKSDVSSSAFDAAQKNLDDGKLVDAAKGFEAIANDASAAPAVKEKAKIQLTLVKEKQKAAAPQMKALLAEAEGLYDAGKLDEAQNALNTIEATGADLGWQDNAKPAALSKKIAEKRVALARANEVKPTTPSTPDNNTTVAVTPPTTPATPATPATPVTPVAPANTGVTLVPNATPAATAPVAPAVDTGNDLLNDMTAQYAIIRDRATTLYNIAMKESTDALAANDYPKAIARAQEAIGTIDANARVFADADVRRLRGAAEQQLAVANQRYEQYKVAQADEARRVGEIKDAEAAIRRDQLRRGQIGRLMGEAENLRRTGKLKEAADVLRQVLQIDEQNSGAKLALALLTDQINYREYERINQRRAAENVLQSIDNQEHLIPYSQLMVYPEDWVELTRKRIGDTANQESPQNRAVRDRMEEEIKEISAENQAFEKVINFLRDNHNVNIFVNWKALEAAAVDRNTPVSVNLRAVSFRKALTTILSEVGGGAANLGYTIDDGVITISTRDDLNSAKYQVVRVFDIRDMLVQPDNNVQVPSFDLNSITRSGSTTGGSGGGISGGGGGGGGGGLFTDAGGAGGQNQTRSREDIIKEITGTITNTIARDSWTENGGTIGSIRELNGQLIVNQTVDNQLAVYNLLQQLRETRALQIAIEARILLVSNNFLDDFGLGWSLSIPAGMIGSNVSAVTVANNTANLVAPPQTGVPGALGLGGTAANSALSLSGSILDGWQLSLLMRATQADRRSSTVTAPRVTLFNGQRGYLAVTSQQNFVSNFNQTVATGGGIGGGTSSGTNLQVSTLTTGIVLYVEATVSADRRYVVMKLRPQLSTLDGIDTFTQSGTDTQSSTNSASQPQLGGGFVQLPRISYTTVDTMVSVPDGGTLLIGGQKLVGESEIEVGVPVLSKIPGLNRLFTNRSFAKDERTLLILVRPKILIQRELETDLFGPNYDKPTGLPGNTAKGTPAVAPR